MVGGEGGKGPVSQECTAWRAGPASWTCDQCGHPKSRTQKGPTFGLCPAVTVLNIPNKKKKNDNLNIQVT